MHWMYCLKVYFSTFQQLGYDVTTESNSVPQENSYNDPLERLVEEQTSISKSSMEPQVDTAYNSQIIEQDATISHEPSTPISQGPPSSFLHQDLMSMIGHNNPMLMRQAMQSLSHAPQLPITDKHLQQVIQSPPDQDSVMRTSKRGFPGSLNLSPYGVGSSSGPRGTHDSPSVNNDRRKRFNRTRDALEKSGLMGITMKTADLLKSNESLEQEILELKKETETLLQSILMNPGNERFKNKYMFPKKS